MEKFDEKTGEYVKYTPRFVHSMDFDTQRRRLKTELELRINDEYKIHLEDYENINDMVRRCVITKTKFVPESNSLATYDSDEDIAQQLPEYSTIEQIDQSPSAGNEPEQEQADVKRSEDKASSNSGSTADEAML